MVAVVSETLFLRKSSLASASDFLKVMQLCDRISHIMINMLMIQSNFFRKFFILQRSNGFQFNRQLPSAPDEQILFTLISLRRPVSIPSLVVPMPFFSISLFKSLQADLA